MKIKLLTIILSSLVVFTFLVYSSCKHDDDINNENCNCNDLTDMELSFLCYTPGNIAIFVNDSSTLKDTLFVTDQIFYPLLCPSYCNSTEGGLTYFSFSNFENFYFHISTNSSCPTIIFGSNKVNTNYYFPLDSATQNMTIDSIAYSDVYCLQTDSSRIDSLGDKLTVPWKIDYSKSNGFIRFYMINGQTWTIN